MNGDSMIAFIICELFTKILAHQYLMLKTSQPHLSHTALASAHSPRNVQFDLTLECLVIAVRI